MEREKVRLRIYSALLFGPLNEVESRIEFAADSIVSEFWKDVLVTGYFFLAFFCGFGGALVRFF